MFVEIRKEYKQPINPSGFWITIGLTVLILWAILSGKTPRLSPKLDEALLAAYWAFMLFHVLRHGWRALPWLQAVLLVSYTLTSGGHVWPHSFFSRPWVQVVGNVGFLTVMLSQVVEFRRGRRVTAPSDDGASSTV